MSRPTGIKAAPQMVGRSARWGGAWLGLSAMGGCNGGLTLNALVLLVSLGIFVGTILLERSP